MDTSVERAKGSVTVVASVRKGDTAALITNGTDAFPEDSFVGAYWTAGDTTGVAILEPQYKPGTLYALMAQNNTLAQCVEAMEVNIDGTGHSIELTNEGDPEVPAEKLILEDFFKEPYPGKSMTEIRRACRRDIEAAGNGYIEAIRNAADELVMLNWVDCIEMRLIRMDEAVPVDKVLTRGGKEITVRVRSRERRFVQLINGKKTYFKEFGSKRDLDRTTGEWAKEGVRLPLEKRASEIIHFTGNKEPKTPYGSPRWLNQLPSVLGSRKAEEHNLEFFDAGGLPPVLIIVQGGTLGTEVKEDLRAHLSGKGNKHRAAIVEAISTSGSIDSAGSVQVRVERFGAERQQDAMFQMYDKNCEEHVRTAFRLPPMFIGKAADFNFATAYTAYMVAEAQVFYPERDEFDAKMNLVARDLGVKSYRFRSLPMTLVDVANQMKAIEIAATAKIVDGEGIVRTLNEITGLALEYKEPPEVAPPPVGKTDPLTGLPYTQPAPPPPHPIPADATGEPAAPVKSTGPSSKPPVKAAKSELVQLAANFAGVLGLDGDCYLSGAEQLAIRKEVGDLEHEDLQLLNEILAVRTLAVTKSDVESLSELCGCAAHLTEV